MGSSDKIVGGSACIAAVVIFIYYTTWSLVLPFLSETNSLQQLFPPWILSIYLPATLLMLGVLGIAAFVLKTTSKNSNKQKAK
ncbi:dolichol phosphate-mannose biosynthesis regulatory [Pilobolus umbonatus]|nr:dolichol phosphate-mannose biosynthesis regulatory [Pilobolus umbonatus]